MITRILMAALAAASLYAQAPISRDEVLDAMKKAADFYVNKVSTSGAYHYTYTDDLSYGRSEHGEGLTQTENQRAGTPTVAMAFLEAWEATGDSVFLDAATKAAQAVVEGQLCSGGWDKLIEFNPAKRARYPYRTNGPCAAPTSKTIPTTLDDNTSQATLRFLMRVDRALNFRDKAIHEAALFALDSMIKAQYPNGAWPQRYTAPPDPAKFPVKRASYPDSWPRKWPGEEYLEHYTLNDNTIADCIDTMLEAARIYNKADYRASAEKGGGFLLLAQMPDPQPAWAQQYDLNMQPAWARVFEPPSVTGGESQGVLELLMLLYRETGDRKYLEPIPRALEYLEKSVLPPSNAEARRRIPAGVPALARFYELKTNRPLYITKGTQVRARGLGSIRPDGYQISYTDESIITHYGVVTSGGRLKTIREAYERMKEGKPEPRPVALHGLSPWEIDERAPLARRATDAAVRKIIDAMDERGAWTQTGAIGRDDLVVGLFAAHPMVLTINGRVIPIAENDDIRIYDGPEKPREKVISSTTFARNLETLAAWIVQNKK